MEFNTTPRAGDNIATTGCVIFSKDRALQLHALLSSYFEKVENPAPVYLLYQATTSAHQHAYEEVFENFLDRKFQAIAQESRKTFKDQLIGILDSLASSRVVFLVDDIVFIESMDLNDLTKFDVRTTIPSLRMGGNLKRAYTTQQEQPLPPFVSHESADDDKLCWIWGQGEYDWSYPLSVDGHLFSTGEIRILTRYTTFHSPNTFESNLQAYAKLFKKRHGICYKKAKILNIPANRVQTDINNIHGAVHQDYLLEQWNRGMQMDYRSLYGFVNESAHQDVPIAFIARN